MTDFSIDMDDPTETWEMLYRQIEATAEVGVGSLGAGSAEGIGSPPAEDLIGWLWLMHACWADEVS